MTEPDEADFLDALDSATTSSLQTSALPPPVAKPAKKRAKRRETSRDGFDGRGVASQVARGILIALVITVLIPVVLGVIRTARRRSQGAVIRQHQQDMPQQIHGRARPSSVRGSGKVVRESAYSLGTRVEIGPTGLSIMMPGEPTSETVRSASGAIPTLSYMTDEAMWAVSYEKADPGQSFDFDDGQLRLFRKGLNQYFRADPRFSKVIKVAEERLVDGRWTIQCVAEGSSPVGSGGRPFFSVYFVLLPDYIVTVMRGSSVSQSEAPGKEFFDTLEAI